MERLNSRDIGKALAFYKAVFGFEIIETEMGTADAPMLYRELQIGGRTVAGALEMTDSWPEGVPSHWLAYFAVEDTDASVAKAQELGAIVHVPPTDIEPGPVSVLADPMGAAFAILKM